MSDAFQRGWGVVKMPIVPNSVRYEGKTTTPGRETEMNRYSATFRDPEDDKLYPMRGFYGIEPEDGRRWLDVDIADEVNPKYKPGLGPSSEAKVFPASDREQYEDIGDPDIPRAEYPPEPHEWIGHIEAYPERRGRGTSMYDLVAMILQDQRPGDRLFPHPAQSEEGSALWNNRWEWLPPDKDEVGEIQR